MNPKQKERLQILRKELREASDAAIIKTYGNNWTEETSSRVYLDQHVLHPDLPPWDHDIFGRPLKAGQRVVYTPKTGPANRGDFLASVMKSGIILHIPEWSLEIMRENLRLWKIMKTDDGHTEMVQGLWMPYLHIRVDWPGRKHMTTRLLAFQCRFCIVSPILPHRAW